MLSTLKAALAYFALVFGAGFMLGAVRVPFVVPRIGVRWAELAEMPIMGIAIFLAAGLVLRRFPVTRLPGRALLIGLLALAFLILAELGLVLVFEGQTLGDYLANRDPVSGPVFGIMLLVFGIMPRLRLASRRFAWGKA